MLLEFHFRVKLMPGAGTEMVSFWKQAYDWEMFGCLIKEFALILVFVRRAFDLEVLQTRFLELDLGCEVDLAVELVHDEDQDEH